MICVLIDAGLRRSPAKITEAIYSLRRQPQDVRAIIITHAHPDHVGGLAEMKRRTGAEVWMHPADAALVRDGRYGRPPLPASAPVGRALGRLLNLRLARRQEPVAVAHEVSDAEVLPFDGLRAIHTPGHSAGHLALLLPREGGVLFLGDAASNWLRPGLGALHEDAAESLRSLEKLASLEFKVACFAHGRPIRKKASATLRELVRRLQAQTEQASGSSGSI